MLEAVDMRLGHIDRQLTMLEKTGAFDRSPGLRSARITDAAATPQRRATGRTSMSFGDRLHRYGVPVLGGLPIGHGPGSRRGSPWHHGRARCGCRHFDSSSCG